MTDDTVLLACEIRRRLAGELGRHRRGDTRQEEARLARTPQLRRHAAAFGARKWTTARAETPRDRFALRQKRSTAITVTFQMNTPKTLLPAMQPCV